MRVKVDTNAHGMNSVDALKAYHQSLDRIIGIGVVRTTGKTKDQVLTPNWNPSLRDTVDTAIYKGLQWVLWFYSINMNTHDCPNEPNRSKYPKTDASHSRHEFHDLRRRRISQQCTGSVIYGKSRSPIISQDHDCKSRLRKCA